MATLRIPFPMRPMDGGRFDLASQKIGDWLASPKFNGLRALVHLPTGSMYNRHGQVFQRSQAYSQAVSIMRTNPELAKLTDWVDCEAMGYRNPIARGTLIVLDYIPKSETPLPNQRRFDDRAADISHAFPGRLAPINPLQYEDNTVYISPVRDGEESLWEALGEANKFYPQPKFENTFYEGIVSKRANSPYVCGRKERDETFLWVKHRFQ